MIETKVMEYLSKDHFQSLNFLYAPLIGKNALCLYQFLYYLPSNMEQEEVNVSLNINETQYRSAIQMLLQYHLIQFYTNKENQLILLYAPLLQNEFLIHDTYSRLYLSCVGAKVFDQMKIKFKKETKKIEGYEQKTCDLDISRLDSWTEAKEIMYEKVKPNIQETYEFDFQTFFKGMDHIFPLRFRTKDNLNRIAQLAKIYGISAKDMRKYVQRSVNPSTGFFDMEKVKKMAVSARKSTDSSQDPYKMSPVHFLQEKQNGIPVIKSDKLLIEKLCTDFQFPVEVVNTLIEYTLEQTNQQFSRNYVEKVAANWVRLNVDSRQKALQVIQKEKPTSKSVPKVKLDDKFYEKRDNKTPEEIQKETLALQKMLKEGKL